MRIAVCDDEEYMRRRLEQILKEFMAASAGISVQSFFFESGEALLASEESYDIIILDIDMKGMNGIQTAEWIRRKDRQVKIIYLTNYTDYSLFAFKVHAFAYLLKSEDVKTLKDELFLQLKEACFYLEKDTAEELEFVTVQGHITLKIRDIYYFEYQNRKVRMVTAQGIYDLKKKIADVAEEMFPFDFRVPHKSFAVNLYRVRSIQGSDLLLTEGTLIPLSQKKAAAFRRELNRYLAGRIHGREGVI